MLDTCSQAARLGISDSELTVLLDVRDALECGAIAASAFDMRQWECGTVACIGGHMTKVLGDEWAAGHADSSLPLHKLLLPANYQALRASPDQAVAAIDRWIASEGREAW